jgi:hypothetical protein
MGDSSSRLSPCTEWERFLVEVKNFSVGMKMASSRLQVPRYKENGLLNSTLKIEEKAS